MYIEEMIKKHELAQLIKDGKLNSYRCEIQDLIKTTLKKSGWKQRFWTESCSVYEKYDAHHEFLYELKFHKDSWDVFEINNMNVVNYNDSTYDTWDAQKQEEFMIEETMHLLDLGMPVDLYIISFDKEEFKELRKELHVAYENNMAKLFIPQYRKLLEEKEKNNNGE